MVDNNLVPLSNSKPPHYFFCVAVWQCVTEQVNLLINNVYTAVVKRHCPQKSVMFRCKIPFFCTSIALATYGTNSNVVGQNFSIEKERGIT